MSQITKIKEDKLGLYVIAGGWISRPFYGTQFKKDDGVKTHHFGGTTNAGVTLNTKKLNFKRSNGEQHFEYWCTTGTMAYEYKKTSDKTLKEQFDWYKKHSRKSLYIELNKKFSNGYGKMKKL